MKVHRITIEGKIPSEAVISRMLAATQFTPFPRAADRRAWRKIAALPQVKPGVQRLIQAAEKAAKEPTPFLKATDYVAFHREGTRDPYDSHAGPRRSRLDLFCTAECFEYKGRFLDAILNEAWAIAEETVWWMSAHCIGCLIPDVERGQNIDLLGAQTAQVFGRAVYLLGAEMDKFTTHWRKRLNYEIRRRVIEPYLNSHGFWQDGTHNWNAVCHCGVVTSTLLADSDLTTKARVLHKVLDRIRCFLRGFSPDGGCSEGPGYWQYGVSHFATLAYLVDRATGGHIDLLADPVCRPIFEYPTKVVLSHNQVVPFSDCPVRCIFASGPVIWAALKLGAKPMAALASRGAPPRALVTNPLEMLLMCDAVRKFEPPKDAWLPNLQVMIARGKGAEGKQLVLAAKGGHNEESHNHNDVGNFIVHWRGESLVCELGAPRYTRDYFTKIRYKLLCPSSLGHNVPLVNGVQQHEGKSFCATNVSHRLSGRDVTFSMDLARAYPKEAGLKSLLRTLTLRRDGAEAVELTDQVGFSGPKRGYQLPLYSVGRFEKAGRGKVLAIGRKERLTVEFDPEALDVRLEDIDLDQVTASLVEEFGPVIHRCMLSLRGSAAEPTVRLRFVPGSV